MSSGLMTASDRLAILGSERQIPATSVRVGNIDLRADLDVTVYLRPRLGTQEHDSSPAAHHVVSRQEWAARYGASPQDLRAVEGFAAEYGLAVTSADAGRRAIVLRGTVEQISRAFGADLRGLYIDGKGEDPYRGRSGPLTVPASLAGIITGVFGIDDRPQATGLSPT